MYESLTLDDFLCNTRGNTEEPVRYVPGGYYPAVLGDTLGESSQRQYILMHKLDWKPNATVWLAQATDEAAFVSVKITTADVDDGQISREVEMLKKVAKAQPDQSSSHVITLLDHFKLHSPNGTHTVIVTDIVIPILSLLSPQCSPAWRKAAAYGVARAMIQLHASQIVHGDCHLRHVGIAMPQLTHQDSEYVMSFLSYPELTAVLTRNAAKQTSALPAYLISSCDIAAFYKERVGSALPQSKVFDLGSAHEIGTQPGAFPCAVEVCAPEIVARISEKVDHPAPNPPTDVWALGAIIYEIVTGSVLFDGVDMTALPFHMCTLAGDIPPHWEKWFTSLSGKTFTKADAEESWALHWKAIRRGSENDQDANTLLRLLKSILVFDPTQRPTPAQIVDDPWFKDVSLANGTATAPYPS